MPRWEKVVYNILQVCIWTEGRETLLLYFFQTVYFILQLIGYSGGPIYIGSLHATDTCPPYVIKSANYDVILLQVLMKIANFYKRNIVKPTKYSKFWLWAKKNSWLNTSEAISEQVKYTTEKINLAHDVLTCPV